MVIVIVYCIFVKTNIVLYCGDTAAAVDTQHVLTTVVYMHLTISIV